MPNKSIGSNRCIRAVVGQRRDPTDLQTWKMVILLAGGTLNTVTAMVSETLESAGVGTSDENSQTSIAQIPRGMVICQI